MEVKYFVTCPRDLPSAGDLQWGACSEAYQLVGTEPKYQLSLKSPAEGSFLTSSPVLIVVFPKTGFSQEIWGDSRTSGPLKPSHDQLSSLSAS